MVPLLSEFWRFVQYAFRPEDQSDGAQFRHGPTPALADSALAGTVKTLLWACLAVLAGLALGQLGG